ncbi:MAG TPA: diguanylate cyclase [Paludibaculum sp.]|jgi:diguanylate cyclase (GGDEF)-like protein/putative nucleotidyltransferase with HDIG domain
MSTVAKTYQRLIIVLGATVLMQQFRDGTVLDPMQYFSYLVLAVSAALFRVAYRTEQGQIPLHLLFILITMRALSPAETFFLGSASALAHAWAGSKDSRQRWTDCLFAASAMAIAIGMTDFAFHSQYLPQGRNELNDALQAILAGTTLFVGLSIPWAAREFLLEGGKLAIIWKDRHFWMLPYFVAGAILARVFDTARAEVGWQIPMLALLMTFLFYRSYRLYMGRLEDGRDHAEEMASLHLRTIEALALAIDAKDQTTHDHLERVQVYAVELGKELGLDDAHMEAIRAASLLHDIGKLAVPEHIISKPGRLTPEEFEKMKIHPVVGAEILERVQFPYPVVPMVRYHHEKWDGSGYPEGLKGEAIPIGARILSAVDCLDALATDRQYRKALPLDQAIAVVVQEAGRAFDPRIVEVLARRYVELEHLAGKHHIEPLKLSTELKIEAGAAPAAGFESSSVTPSGRPPRNSDKPEFLTQIAAARQEAQALFEVAQNLGSSLSLDETLSVLSVRLKRIVPHDSLAVYIKRGNLLVPEFVAGDNFRLFSALEIPIGQGLSGWVAENAKPILNGNPSVEPGYLNDTTKFSTLRSALAVPLEGINGVVGVLSLYTSERDAFTRDHLRVMLVVSSKLALSIENALRYRQAETSATIDYLTELPNARSLFLHLDSEIARCRLTSDTLAALVCDMDNFKQINDQYGHIEGNKILKVVAAALKSSCRGSDYVARMGGDEFVVILPGIKGPAVAQRVEQLSNFAVAEARLQTGLELTISIGHALFPEDGDNAEELLSAADRAMYKAKAVNPERLKSQRNWAEWAERAERAQGSAAIQ